MIKITNLNKYYNKGKSNEIHVINNTSIEFPSTGLISFIGSSGSGKTTLLNTIGGLDKATGLISYNDIEFNKYQMNQIDKYRKKNIGYIFQNYLILEEETVYNNLKIALEIIGVTDPIEQDKRISYTLNAVGLYKYRKKLAGALSGGQMQRVSIARALVKNNKIIIADEPTGNLDSENSIEIMNILKKISEKTLVLLVTHNKELAEFYSDKIVYIKDGQIISINDNINSESLDHESNNKIYLLDYNKEELLSKNYNINLYSKEDITDSRNDINIIIKNDTIYIESKKKIQIVDNNIKIYNDHYEKLSLKKLDSFDYDISFYNDSKKKKKLKAILDEFKFLISDFFNVKKKSKAFHFIFFLIGFLIGLMIVIDSNFNINSSISETNEPNSSYITTYFSSSDSWVKLNYVSNDVLNTAIDNNYIYDLSPKRTSNAYFSYKKNSVNTISFNISNFGYFYNDQPILVGKKPTTSKEIVIGKEIADTLISKIDNKLNYSDLLGITLNYKYTISGVSSLNTNSYYYINYENKLNFTTIIYDKVVLNGVSDNEIILSKELMNQYSVDDEIIYNGTKLKVYSFADLGIAFGASKLALNKNLYYDYDKHQILENKTNNILDCVYVDSHAINYTSLEGRLPISNTECVVNSNTGYKINDIVNGLTITGLYTSDDTYNIYNNISNNSLRSIPFNIENKNIIIRDTKYILKQVLLSPYYNEFVYLINDSIEAKDFFNKEALSYQNCFDYTKTEELKATKSDRYTLFIVEVVLLCICVIYTYFSTRSKMIFDIYEIGVYRSLGASKQRIYNKYIKENFIKITFTSAIGYLLVIIIYSIFARKFNNIITGYVGEVGFLRAFLSLLIMYLSQIIIGLIPVFILLRKTPAEINSKYDI